MPQQPDEPSSGAGLNPALKAERDTSHDVRRSPGPLETTGAHEGQGGVWPIVWLVVTVVGIALAVWFVI